jgi:ankyrin repeat protein
MDNPIFLDNEQIFNLIKNQKFEQVYKLIKERKITELDIRDSNYNYFIHLVVNYNQVDLLELILKLATDESLNIRLDILDTDGRSILYNCIKFNYLEIMKLLLKYNSINIGINIFDIKDRLGLTALHYSVIFNNFESFKLLLEYKADPYAISKEGSNVFVICLIYKRNEMIEYLLNLKYNLNFTSPNGETLLQLATTYNNINIINKLLATNINLNNVSSDFGLSVLHQSIIFDNFDLFKKLLSKNVNYNVADFYGNTPLHYILIDKRIRYLNLLVEKTEIKFNVSNINGEIPLHILLDSNIDFGELDDKIINKIILESDLNIQNNQGITCLMKIIAFWTANENFIKKFRDLLVLKPLNFFIEDNNFQHMKLTDEIIEILVESYYNQIKINKDELLIDWERWCSSDSYDKLKTIIKEESGDNSEKLCKSKIRQIIVKEKRSIPRLSNIDINFDNGIFVNNCYYTGTPIDILFGLVLLNNDFKSKGLSVILDYPLTINTGLENYYQKISLDYPYKLDFSNIEIVWSYQKIFYPSYFDEEIMKLIKESKYITIPIGIETSIGSHANILFWDIKNKTIERFEPNGSNYPMGMNYNPELLDDLISSRFKQFDPDIQYYPPYNFLPPISFQILEGLETPKCKRIGDPNGFCGVWCIWWVYQRMLNISNNKMTLTNVANELINRIKFDNQSFKSLIRNFSKKITEIRDGYLKKFHLDINDWILGNYNGETLDKLEKDIFKNIKK